MTRLRTTQSPRRGAIAPLTALLMIPFLAMVAFAIDIGWIVQTETELQSVADAAALAGAQQLMGDSQYLNGIVQYYSPGQTLQQAIMQNAKANAILAAKNYASFNRAGGVSNLVLKDDDIEFGYTDGSGTYTAQPTYTGFPNTVKVIVRRDSKANGSLNLFFAPVIGSKSVDLAANAAATIYSGTVDNLSPNSSQMAGILPVAYDVNHWNNFLQTGQGPDGTIDNAANGAPQLQVYPSIKYKGNFGLLSLDQGNDGASTIWGWINNGVSAADLQHEYDAGLLPLSAHNPLLWDWKGDSGLKTSDIHALASAVGKNYLLPLFKPLNDGSIDPNLYRAGVGQGTNYFYNIVQFVGVTVTYVDNKSVHVQPNAKLDPSAVFSNVAPAGPPAGGSTLVTTFTTPKLTQ